MVIAANRGNQASISLPSASLLGTHVTNDISTHFLPAVAPHGLPDDVEWPRLGVPLDVISVGEATYNAFNIAKRHRSMTPSLPASGRITGSTRALHSSPYHNNPLYNPYNPYSTDAAVANGQSFTRAASLDPSIFKDRVAVLSHLVSSKQSAPSQIIPAICSDRNLHTTLQELPTHRGGVEAGENATIITGADESRLTAASGHQTNSQLSNGLGEVVGMWENGNWFRTLIALFNHIFFRPYLIRPWMMTSPVNINLISGFDKLRCYWYTAIYIPFVSNLLFKLVLKRKSTDQRKELRKVEEEAAESEDVSGSAKDQRTCRRWKLAGGNEERKCNGLQVGLECQPTIQNRRAVRESKRTLQIQIYSL